VVFGKKIQPDSEDESLWMFLSFDDYIMGHGE
jgi:hypothetical protein